MSPRRVVLAMLLSLSPGLAFSQVAATPTFVVNTYTTGDQFHPRVAVSGRQAAIIWCDRGRDAILARVFDAGTGAVGAEFQVNSAALPQDCGIGGMLNVAAANPGFAVVWEHAVDARAQLFNWLGQRIGAEFQVNSTFDVRSPSAAWTPQGELLVVWYQVAPSAPIRGQRFDSQGNRVGGEFGIDTAPLGGTFTGPAVSAARDARMAVAWWHDGHVFARRLDGSGAPVGSELQVSTETVVSAYPSVALNDRGFMVVWRASQGPHRVVGRSYDRDGNPLSGEFTIDTTSNETTAVAPYGGDRYVVTWTGAGISEPKRARLFEATGSPHGPVFVVTSTPDYIGPQFARPQVAADAVGNMLFSWVRLLELGPRFTDIMSRVFYGGLIPQTPAVDPTAGPASDGNGVVEACETVVVRPAWRNDTAATQAVSGTLSSFTGPPGATYTVVDGLADYGTVADGAAASCTSDCYAVAVSCATPRPAAHWDARLVEDLGPVPQQGQFRLHVGESFQDVPRSSPYYRFVETLLHQDITAGCGAARYCPASAVTREQMAVFVLLAKEEADYAPRPCFTSSFSDVETTRPTCPYIHALANRGVVSGCGNGRFCPTDPVTREQMAVFVLRTVDPTLDPPACTTPRFADVPASSPYCRWIEELARRGVVSGCGGLNYCPAAVVSREQMAVFLGASFCLTLNSP